MSFRVSGCEIDVPQGVAITPITHPFEELVRSHRRWRHAAVAGWVVVAFGLGVFIGWQRGEGSRAGQVGRLQADLVVHRREIECRKRLPPMPVGYSREAAAVACLKAALDGKVVSFNPY